MNVSIFDVLGPVMIGPSSSHTAGAAKLSRAARLIARGEISHISFGLHGSFAQTYKGHGTDRALVAGLVQLPCAQRNASQAVNALLSADLALGGMNAVIPADEVIEAMYKVGRQLPIELKETALGGVAATPTGKQLKDSIFSK